MGTGPPKSRPKPPNRKAPEFPPKPPNRPAPKFRPEPPALERPKTGQRNIVVAGLPLKVKCAHDDRNYTYTVPSEDGPRPFEVVAGPGSPETFKGLRFMHRIMPDDGESLATPEELEIKDAFGGERSLLCACQEVEWSNLWALRDLTRLWPQSTPLLPQGRAGAYAHAYPDIRWDIDLTFDLGALKYDYDDQKDEFDLPYQEDWGVRGEGQEISKFTGKAFLDFGGRKIDCTYWVARYLPNLLGGWFYSIWDLYKFGLKIANMGCSDGWSENPKQIVLGSSTIDLPVINIKYRAFFQEQKESPEVWVYRKMHWSLQPAFGASINWDILDTVLKLIPLGVGYLLSKVRKVRAGSPETGFGWHHELAIVLTASGGLIIAKGTEVLFNHAEIERSLPTEDTGFNGRIDFGLEGVAKAKGALCKLAFDAGVAVGARTAIQFSRLVSETEDGGQTASNDPLTEGKEVSADLMLRLYKLLIYYIQWATCGSVAEVFMDPDLELVGRHKDHAGADVADTGGKKAKKVKKGEAYKRRQLDHVFDGDCKIGKNKYWPTVFKKMSDIEPPDRHAYVFYTLYEWERRYKRAKQEYDNAKSEKRSGLMNRLKGCFRQKKSEFPRLHKAYKESEADLKSARALFKDVHFRVLWEDKVWTHEGRKQIAE